MGWGGDRVRNMFYSVSDNLVAKQPKCVCGFHRAPFGQAGKFGGKKVGFFFFF